MKRLVSPLSARRRLYFLAFVFALSAAWLWYLSGYFIHGGSMRPSQPTSTAPAIVVPCDGGTVVNVPITAGLSDVVECVLLVEGQQTAFPVSSPRGAPLAHCTVPPLPSSLVCPLLHHRAELRGKSSSGMLSAPIALAYSGAHVHTQGPMKFEVFDAFVHRSLRGGPRCIAVVGYFFLPSPLLRCGLLPSRNASSSGQLELRHAAAIGDVHTWLTAVVRAPTLIECALPESLELEPGVAVTVTLDGHYIADPAPIALSESPQTLPRGALGPGAVVVCAMIRNEEEAVAEWLQFHLSAATGGIAHFFLYDNLSEDKTAAELQPFVASGKATVVRWPYLHTQTAALTHCLHRHARPSGAKWVLISDPDEFVAGDLRALLRESSDAGREGLALVMLNFGGNGWLERPPIGMSTPDAFTLRAWRPHAMPILVVATDRTWGAATYGPHMFRYLSGTETPYFVDSTHVRINHYRYKSRASYVKRRTGVDSVFVTLKTTEMAVGEWDRAQAAVSAMRDCSLSTLEGCAQWWEGWSIPALKYWVWSHSRRSLVLLTVGVGAVLAKRARRWRMRPDSAE